LSDTRRVLVVAPHPDDETLGCGGSMARFVEEGNEITVLVVSGHLPPLYPRDAYDRTVRESACAMKILGVTDIRFLEIPATMVANEPTHVLNERIGAVFREVRPQVVLMPFPDRHVDHRAIFDSVMVATRPVGIGRDIQFLAAYETLSETHWNALHIEANFMPTWVVDITKYIERKLDAVACYESQIPEFPGSRSVQAVEALSKFRGTQAGFAFGEAFQVIRIVS
jgi:LmbE family N-acetylglucosaminyl deacetylase